jgi:iduronate 2-sulfatase
MSLFEQSARVPLLIVAPGVAKQGTVAETPVGLIDLYPTLSELCGVSPPEDLQGQSLVPMLQDVSATGRGWALSQVTRGGNARVPQFFGYSLRTPRWRYTEWDEGQQGRELYDHRSDPGELTNLAGDPAHAQTIEELASQLHAAVQATFPASGETPPLREGVWAPNLTEP